MKLSARLFLLLTGIVALAYYLPAAFELLAARQERTPVVFYSSVEHRFLFSRHLDGEMRYTDLAGRIYDREEFERLTPLTNWAQVSKDGRLPKEIDGVPITLEAVRRAQFSVRLKPVQFDSPLIPLAPLLEAGGQRARLEMPSDYLRLGAAVEFVDPKTNTLLADKTAKFAAAFTAAGFHFPVTFANSNPTNRKPYDEGFFLTDATGAVFQLRQIRGEPELRRIADVATDHAAWSSLRARYIHVQEIDSRELRAVLLDPTGHVQVALGQGYRLVTLPLQHYDPATTELTLRGNLLHRLIVAESPGHLEAIVLDRDYRPLDRYDETLPQPRDRFSGRLASVLFPFTWETTDDSSGYLGFYAQAGSRWALALNAGLLVAWLGWQAWRRQLALRRWPESLAIAVGGLYGLLAAVLLPRSD